MKTVKVLIGIASIILLGVFLWWGSRNNKNGVETEGKINGTMTLTSTAFNEGRMIPPKYTCNGENISPPLEIGGVSPDAKSLVLIVDDPDAPLGVWTHWFLWNIDPQVTSIGEGSVPAGAIQGKNSFGKNNYGGPCPPLGQHHYRFKIYALKQTLNLPETSRQADLEKAMSNLIVDKRVLTGVYKHL